MRSKIAQELINETPQEIKDKVDAHVDKLMSTNVSKRFLRMVIEYIETTEVTMDYEFGKGRTDFNEISKDGKLPEIYKMAKDYLG